MDKLVTLTNKVNDLQDELDKITPIIQETYSIITGQNDERLLKQVKVIQS